MHIQEYQTIPNQVQEGNGMHRIAIMPSCTPSVAECIVFHVVFLAQTLALFFIRFDCVFVVSDRPL